MSDAKRNLIKILLLIGLTAAGRELAYGQLTEATLRGQITDTSGHRIAGAPVTIRSLGTGLLRSAVSGNDGTFLLAGLAPGAAEAQSCSNGATLGACTGNEACTYTTGWSAACCVASKADICLCPASCQGDGDCDAGSYCAAQRCEPLEGGCPCASDGDCAQGQSCFSDHCVIPSCVSDADCGAGSLCDPTLVACVSMSCASAADCDAGWSCDNNRCGPPACVVDADCGDGMVCVVGGCAQAECSVDADCEAGESCDGGLCFPTGAGGSGGGPGGSVSGGGDAGGSSGSSDSGCSATSGAPSLAGLLLLGLLLALGREARRLRG